MTTAAPTDGPDTRAYAAYLALNRAFGAASVAEAVSRVPSGTRRALDLGTGGGAALGPLARLVGDGGHVLGVDLDHRALAVATEHAATLVEGHRIELRAADGLDVADEAARAGTPFDLVWAADVIWPGVVSDPAGVVARLAAAVAPGGAVALYASQYYRATFLPGHSRLERLLLSASERTWGLPPNGPDHPERLGAWLTAAGLEVSLHAVPVARMLREDRHADAYLRRIVWPELRHAARTSGAAAGMSERDLAEADELLDPDHPRYVGGADASDAAHVVQPAVVWIGRRGD